MDKNGQLTTDSPEFDEVQPQKQASDAPKPTVPGAIKEVSKDLTNGDEQ